MQSSSVSVILIYLAILTSQGHGLFQEFISGYAAGSLILPSSLTKDLVYLGSAEVVTRTGACPEDMLGFLKGHPKTLSRRSIERYFGSSGTWHHLVTSKIKLLGSHLSQVDVCRLSVQTTIIVGIPYLVVAVGFTPAGISAHSLASFLMSISAKYNCGTAVIAALQSLGAKGFTWRGYAALYILADKVADIVCVDKEGNTHGSFSASASFLSAVGVVRAGATLHSIGAPGLEAAVVGAVVGKMVKEVTTED